MAPDEKRLTTAQRWILCLLVISAWLNFIDRGARSAAAPAIKTELGLTLVQLGYLLSAFFSAARVGNLEVGRSLLSHEMVTVNQEFVALRRRR